MEKQNSPTEIRLSQKQMLGIAGCLITFVGVFMPIISFPSGRDLNYFGNGRGDGVLLLILSVISFVLVLTKLFKWLWFTGGVSFALICFTFTIFQQRLSVSKKAIERAELRGYVFAEERLAVIDGVQLKWGWAVIVIGVGCVLACAVIDRMDAKR